MTPAKSRLKTILPAPAVAGLGVKACAYAFCSAGLPEPLATEHAATAHKLLTKMFGLPPEAVAVKFKERLPEAVPFTLTCSRGKASSEVAVILAAKQVLPRLRACQARALKLAVKLARV